MSSQTDANKKVIEHFNVLLGEGRLDEAFELTTDDCTWFSLSGRKTFTRNEVKAVIQWVAKTALRQPVKLTPLAVTAEEDRVALMADGQAVTTDGMEYNNMYQMLYKLRDGKICAAWEFNDTHYVRQTLRRGKDGELGLPDGSKALPFSTTF